jgi:NAD(P)-dependent dehydrogenase (short-subunit alcohol dehydrogenase family)
VVCDLSDLASVRQAADRIIAMGLPIAALVNNAGIMEMRPLKTSQGWDLTFATNHLGPVAFTQALAPALPDGSLVLFVVSAVEDPERKPAVAAGFRGGRFLSVTDSVRGIWKAGGAERPGFDAYATSKQALLASTFAFARETPRLRFAAIEPGFNPSTGLGGHLGPAARFVQAVVVPLVVPLLKPFIKILSTSRQAGRVIAQIVTSSSSRTGTYFDEKGKPMTGSVLVQDPNFQDRVLAETRAFLSESPAR